MKIYLAGKVPKGEEISDFLDWRAFFTNNASTNSGITFLSPVDPALDESIPGFAFGFACFLVKDADLVLVDASTRLGVGTAQEILIAKYLAKCVICLLPPETPHRRKNLKMYEVTVTDWVHPFIAATVDYIVDTPQSALDLINNIQHGRLVPQCKSLDLIDAAIADYVVTKHDAKLG